MMLGPFGSFAAGAFLALFSSWFSDAPFEGGWTLRADMPVAVGVEGIPCSAAVYQKGADLRVAFRLEREAGSAPVAVKTTLSFDPKHFLVKGMPVMVDVAAGAREDGDYVFRDERMFFDVEITDGLRYLEMTVCSRKLKNRGELSIEDKLKQARTVRRIRQKLDTWSALFPGQIIAQETLRPIVCHGGYDARGVKTAVVWANGKKLTGEFRILDVLHNRQHPAPQPVVYKGELKPVGFHVWGGNNYVADFSDFRTEGVFCVRVIVKETREVVDSHTFEIRKGRYLDLARKAARWFYCQKCGAEVPGFHKACHTEDTIIRLDGTRVDVSGGWHDAGDYGKWIGGGTMGIFALTTLQEEFGWKPGDTPEGMGGFIDEAAWEAAYFCKAYWDGFFHACFTPDFEDVCTWLGAPETEPPRIVREEEMLENEYGYTGGPGISWTGASLARIGRLLWDKDGNLAEKCISIAKEVYDLDSGVDLSAPEYSEKSNSYLWLQTGLLMSALELYEATGDDKYVTDARKRAENILALQDEEGPFFLDRDRTSQKYPECRYHLFALNEFLNRGGDGGLGGAIRNAFRRWADHAMRFTKVSPFGLIGGEAKDGSLRSLPPGSKNRKLAAYAWGLAAAALACEEPSYLDAAERQLQWILGFNAADVSMMAGVGYGPGCYHARYCFMEGCEDGVVPGGILNGIVGGTGKDIYMGDNDTKNFVIGDNLPVDYPVIDTDVRGWTYTYASNEYWTRNSAWFVLGALQVEKAARELR